jgi:hypothetical protein
MKGQVASDDRALAVLRERMAKDPDAYIRAQSAAAIQELGPHQKFESCVSDLNPTDELLDVRRRLCLCGATLCRAYGAEECLALCTSLLTSAGLGSLTG